MITGFNNFESVHCRQLHFQTACQQVHLALQSPATQQRAYTAPSHHQHSNSEVQHLTTQQFSQFKLQNIYHNYKQIIITVSHVMISS